MFVRISSENIDSNSVSARHRHIAMLLPFCPITFDSITMPNVLGPRWGECRWQPYHFPIVLHNFRISISKAVCPALSRCSDDSWHGDHGVWRAIPNGISEGLTTKIHVHFVSENVDVPVAVNRWDGIKFEIHFIDSLLALFLLHTWNTQHICIGSFWVSRLISSLFYSFLFVLANVSFQIRSSADVCVCVYVCLERNRISQVHKILWMLCICIGEEICQPTAVHCGRPDYYRCYFDCQQHIDFDSLPYHADHGTRLTAHTVIGDVKGRCGLKFESFKAQFSFRSQFQWRSSCGKS